MQKNYIPLLVVLLFPVVPVGLVLVVPPAYAYHAGLESWALIERHFKQHAAQLAQCAPGSCSNLGPNSSVFTQPGNQPQKTPQSNLGPNSNPFAAPPAPPADWRSNPGSMNRPH